MRRLQIQIPGGMSPQKTITSVPCPVGLPSHTAALDDISENLVRILAFIHLPGTSVLRVAGDGDQWAIWGHNTPRASSVTMGLSFSRSLWITSQLWRCPRCLSSTLWREGSRYVVEFLITGLTQDAQCIQAHSCLLTAPTVMRVYAQMVLNTQMHHTHTHTHT